MKGSCQMFVTDPKPCAAHTCRMLCPHGFALDDDGCPRCQCHDPCSEIECPSALRCELEDVTCFKQPCPPIPRCEYRVSPCSRGLMNVVTVAQLVKKSPSLMEPKCPYCETNESSQHCHTHLSSLQGFQQKFCAHFSSSQTCRVLSPPIQCSWSP